MYNKYEAWTYQLKPENECDSPQLYYTGNVFSAKWIYESIQAKSFLPSNRYLLGFNKNAHKQSLPKGKVNYTMTEILAMMEIVDKAKKKVAEGRETVSHLSLIHI